MINVKKDEIKLNQDQYPFGRSSKNTEQKNSSSGVLVNLYNFGPNLISFNIPSNFHDFLNEESLKSRNNKLITDNRKNLAGHLKEEYLLSDTARKYFCNNLRNYFISYFALIYSANQFKPPKEILLQGLWVNFMKCNEINPPHVHSSDFSFVLYLQVPDEIYEEEKNHIARSPAPGTITFTYGYEHSWHKNNITLMPKKGDFYIFPAHLTHMVLPFKSDVERISISGNIRVLIDDEKKSDTLSMDNDIWKKISFNPEYL
jgi:hypothetical protein